MENKKKQGYSTAKIAGLFLGLAAAAIILMLPGISGLDAVGQKALALTALIVIWWITEPVPIWVSALLPIAVSPLIGLAGVKTTAQGLSVYANYASPVVLMSIGVFLLAAVIEKWGLHKRIALNIVAKVGSKPTRIIMGFALATGFISMFMSNVTATAMMLPIGIALLKQLGFDHETGFAKALILAIAFAASIGGMGTMIGSGTNIAGSALMKDLASIDITFLEWMKVGLPFVILFLPLSVIILNLVFKVKDAKIEDADTIHRELKALGSMSKAEKLTAAYVVIAITGFVLMTQLKKIFPMIADENYAVLIGLALFLIPVDFKAGTFLMDSKTAIREISWSTYLLLGGALVLGDVFSKAGIAKWLASYMGFLANLPEIGVVIAIAIIVAFITEFASNFVVASAFLPPIYGIAVELGINPMLLMMTVTLSASLAFMFPSGTPTNALAFGTGYIDIKDMVKGGFFVKMIGVILFPVVFYFISAPLTTLF
ncbi:SLC13 family permease [Youngiibacter multivorans]|uniref:Sodium-dependent dicarboxylate transporter SdcS n=1 Tax=Youngiibacter multivorans TaxID=937251 RepID=A0ABS4G114_9CLOT|nr:DASS family sodium-coupled anion symporter [Youngiibacter multivorans]MBP1918241.1 sodium-dependent dicarboxylate transporter 2/3/5 [Youngiibacter multivorans]